MQDRANELLRIPLLRTPVNKAKRRAEATLRAPALLSASELLRLLWGNPLGRRSLFKTRRHKLGGLGLDERKLTAIGGDELIETRAIRKGDGACAIRLDGIRAREGLVTRNLPVKVR
jgi:hypothetical protein